MRVERVAVLALVAVVALVVSPAIGNGYLYDDKPVIVDGDVIHDPKNLWELFAHHTYFAYGSDASYEVSHYRPVPLISFMWDAAISGREPWAYHVTNLVMHLVCVALVYAFVRAVVPAVPWTAALAATAWFALTPHPAPVYVWISARYDLFCTAFCLSAVLVWRRALAAPRARAAWLHALAAVLFMLGLLSKEVALMTLPALVLWPEERPVAWRTRVQRVAGFGAACAVYLIARHEVLGGMRASEGSSQVLRALAHLAPLELDGLAGALVPARLRLRFLNAEYGRLTPAALAALALSFALFAAGAFALRRRQPAIAWGLLWYAGVLAPIAVITTMLWPGFGRYLYLPGAGLAVVLASALALWLRAQPALARPIWAAWAGYLVVLAFSLRGYIHDMKDEETLYSAAVLAAPDLPHAYGWLGIARSSEGRYAEAADPLARAHQLAPEEPRYLQHLMLVFVRTGQRDAALAVAERGVELYPRDATPFHLFLIETNEARDPEAACFHALECLRRNPGAALCGEALTGLLTRHPAKHEYRAIARRLLARAEMAAVRRQTAPLLDSLPSGPSAAHSTVRSPEAPVEIARDGLAPGP